MGKKSHQNFELVSDFNPAGDQPKAIEELTRYLSEDQDHVVLLGVTGSGKTFTVAHTIQNLNVPSLILAPNKTLAAQLYVEFKELFPKNAVEYFVSYYDYYQPEAYLPATDTYIEKDSAINEQIDRMRHSATRSLLERRDVIIVSSVSCIYGLGSPEAYSGLVLKISTNQELKRDLFLRELVRVLYKRNDIDFDRGTFRVRGDLVEIFPPYEDTRVLRAEFFGDFIDRISWVDSLSLEVLEVLDQAAIFPGSHYVSTDDEKKSAIKTIQIELQERIKELNSQLKYTEAQRLEQRTYYDIEMIEEIGYCQGIENYSRHFTGRSPGTPPPTLLEYFPSEFICFVDESHITIPQIGGMYRGDRARKSTLVEHGFRLPSALDNRPLNFQEFEGFVHKGVYVSATPGNWELTKSQGLVVEQIIRPTGLLDPEVEVRPARHQVDDLVGEIKKRIKKSQRVMVTTLTKRSAEDLTDYLQNLGLKVKYLHSDIKTVERTEILRDLRRGVFDVLVGINLLREGLDLPEVSLVAITDADKEGFLRSERSLIQTIGRAARNSDGFVILYADHVTESMRKAMEETQRRREIQKNYNDVHGITPTTVSKRISEGLLDVYGMYIPSADSSRVSSGQEVYLKDGDSIGSKILELKKTMKRAAKNLDFEEAARLRDEVRRLELTQLADLEPSALSKDSSASE